MNAPEDRLGPDSVFGDVGSISGLPESGRAANNNGWPRSADIVAKVLLHW
jgi:hypothetical protein